MVLGLAWGLLVGAEIWLSRGNFISADARLAYARLPSLTPPMLARMGQLPSWLTFAAFLPMLILTSVLGLLVVLLVRPKNRAAEIAAGAATGLLGGMAGFAFGGGWLFVVATTLYYPGEDSDLELLSETAWVEPALDQGMPSPNAERKPDSAERLLKKYPDLQGVPARERGRLLYHKIQADWTAGIPLGIWLGFLCIVGMSVVMSIAETLAAGILLRRLGQVRAVIWPYVELAVPGTILVFALSGRLLRFFAGWFTGHSGQLLIGLLCLVFLVLAITAVLRGWHWLVRSLMDLGWMVSFGAWVMLEQARYREMGG